MQAGKIVDGRYEILSELGSGGMGAVFLAREIEIDRVVALKFLHSSMISDEESRLRFFREGKIISSLSHKHILGFFRLGIEESGTPYIAMEYLEGSSLSNLLVSSGSLPWKRSSSIILQIADAMGAAHKLGIVHRDLKPDNVMLLEAPEPDYVKILDFGLARLVAPDADAQKLTQTGSLVGSVFYMSPEQCLGKLADHRSDIYSLGCLFHEMVSGRPPFDCDNPVGMLHKHLNEEPAGVSRMVKQKIIPADLGAVLLGCLAKDPEKRYQQMDQLTADLRLVLEGKAIARAGDLAVRRKAPVRMIWLGLFVAFMVGVGLLAGFGGQSVETAILKIDPSPARQRQALDAVDRAIGEGDWKKADGLLKACESLRQESAAGRSLAISILCKRATIEHRSGDRNEAARVVSQAVRQMNEKLEKVGMGGEDELSLSKELFNAVELCHGNTAGAQADLRKLLRAFSSSRFQEQGERALLRVMRIREGQRSPAVLCGECSAAEKIYKENPKEALSLVEHALSEVKYQGKVYYKVQVQLSAAHAYATFGNSEKAMAILTAARRDLPGIQLRDNQLESRMMMGDILSMCKLTNKAVETMLPVPDWINEIDQGLAISYCSSIWQRLTDQKHFLEAYEFAKQMFSKFSTERSSQNMFRFYMARSLLDQGRTKEGADLLARVIEEKACRIDARIYASNELAEVRMNARDWSGAKDLLEKAAQSAEKNMFDRREIGVIYLDLARCQDGLNKDPRDYVRKAVQMVRSFDDPIVSIEAVAKLCELEYEYRDFQRFDMTFEEACRLMERSPDLRKIWYPQLALRAVNASLERRDSKKAKTLLDSVEKVLKESGADGRQWAAYQSCRANFQLFEGNIAGAEKALEEGEKLTSDPATLGQIEDQRYWIYQKSGRYADAEGIMRKVLSEGEKGFAENPQAEASVRFKLAKSLNSQGKKGEARKEAMRASQCAGDRYKWLKKLIDEELEKSG